MRRKFSLPLCVCIFLVVFLDSAILAESKVDITEFIEMSAETLEDKIQGGLLAQLLGNLNGLAHENKYYDQPGNVTQYTPALPDGARTDDDTDIEWVYIVAMQRA